MKKNLILVITLILVIALTLGACVEPVDEHTHSFATDWTNDATHHWHKATCGDTSEVKDKATHSLNSNNKCTVCGYEKKVTPETPTPSKKIEEIIAEYLLSLGDNFSVSASLSTNIGEILGQGQKYQLSVDGNKIYASNNGDIYYAEESEDGNVYVYTKEEDTWHRSPVDEEYEYPTNIAETLTELLSNVDWQNYNEKTGVATGYIEIDGKEFLVSCTLKETGATIELFTQGLLGYIRVGYAEIYDIGNTTVILPEDFIDDTEVPEPELPPDTELPDTLDDTDKSEE